MDATEQDATEDQATGLLQISRGGRPPFEVTDENRDLVLALTVNGVTAEEVAETLGISLPTLRKYFEDELTHGRRMATAKVGKSLYRAALKADTGEKGFVTAAIFYMKTRAGWSEQEKVVQGNVTNNNLTILGESEGGLELLRKFRELLLAHEQAKLKGEA